MDRLFCALVLTAAMIVSACVIAENALEETQPVFFSMLFPQLMPEFAGKLRRGKTARQARR